MSLFEKATPPPLWSSFPSSNTVKDQVQAVRDQVQAATKAPTPAKNTKPTMIGRFFKSRGHSTEKSTYKIPSRFRDTFSSNHSVSKTSSWDPPAYEEYQTTYRISTGESEFDSLKDFDTILLVDDSSSMVGSRWREAEAAIAAIAPICTEYDSDGVDLYFLNHGKEQTAHFNHSLGHNTAPHSAYKNIKSAEQVREIFSSVAPRGATPVGRRLDDILTPYMRRVERMQQASRNEDGTLSDPSLEVKPVNIITITDGAFTDDAESIIVQVAGRLDRCMARPSQVGIQFFQIGKDEDARQYLQDLDDNLGKRCQDKQFPLRDIVDTVPWRGSRGSTLDAKGILKCVLGAVNKKLDREQV